MKLKYTNWRMFSFALTMPVVVVVAKGVNLLFAEWGLGIIFVLGFGFLCGYLIHRAVWVTVGERMAIWVDQGSPEGKWLRVILAGATVFVVLSIFCSLLLLLIALM